MVAFPVKVTVNLSEATHSDLTDFAAATSQPLAVATRDLLEAQMQMRKTLSGCDLPRLIMIMEYLPLALDFLVHQVNPKAIDKFRELSEVHLEQFHGQ